MGNIEFNYGDWQYWLQAVSTKDFKQLALEIKGLEPSMSEQELKEHIDSSMRKYHSTQEAVDEQVEKTEERLRKDLNLK